MFAAGYWCLYAMCRQGRCAAECALAAADAVSGGSIGCEMTRHRCAVCRRKGEMSRFCLPDRIARCRDIGAKGFDEGADDGR